VESPVFPHAAGARAGDYPASEEFSPVLARLKELVEVDLKGIETTLERLGAPWTPGRVPEWKQE
jgi:hypothetical protein